MLWGIFQFAFPNHQYFPPQCLHGFQLFLVVCFVAVNFFEPPIGSGFWYYKIFAVVVTMPKTSMHKNHRFVFRQYNVWFARQVFYMQPKAITLCMQKLSHQYFRFRIPAFNAAHVVAPRLRAVHIGHRYQRYKA